MVSLSVTVASSCDFADVFAFSKDPDFCFIEASFLDGYEECDVLDTSVTTQYKTYPMTADVSPYYVVTEFDVSGVLSVATDLTGKESTAPALRLPQEQTVPINSLMLPQANILSHSVENPRLTELLLLQSLRIKQITTRLHLTTQVFAWQTLIRILE